ncbi:uncharacterized protein LOC131940908 [Physella acuta]|uniref:uncharacterized protein LOC131940908 n=1 Tax=Physella acuta TaxID=109671 RepID=UPI0027DC8D8A|nr:uncharacterized protein LOC131940908 [Physella acuta]
MASKPEIVLVFIGLFVCTTLTLAKNKSSTVHTPDDAPDINNVLREYATSKMSNFIKEVVDNATKPMYDRILLPWVRDSYLLNGSGMNDTLDVLVPLFSASTSIADSLTAIQNFIFSLIKDQANTLLIRIAHTIENIIEKLSTRLIQLVEKSVMKPLTSVMDKASELKNTVVSSGAAVGAKVETGVSHVVTGTQEKSAQLLQKGADTAGDALSAGKKYVGNLWAGK